MRNTTENLIRINHIGFMPDASKTFVIVNPPETRFTVELMGDTEFMKVYEGTLERVKRDDGEGYIGDFSAVTQEGDYVVRCGELQSRFFVIYKKAYDNTLRTLLQYFTYQRCGSDLGWAGRCHLDDGYIAETGGHVDLSGGYHQSCDLRKSPTGISIGVLGLIRCALNYTPVWKRLLDDEIAWACDYYEKTIQTDGRMYNTLSEPFGWAGRTFYQSAAPASAEWNVVSILALGAKHFGTRDKYLPAAVRAYNYMVSDARPGGVYHHPAKVLPRGMDAEGFFYAIYKGSAADIAYRIAASHDLFAATGDEKYLSDASALQVALSACVSPLPRVEAASEKLLLNKCNYAWAPAAMNSLDSDAFRDVLLEYAGKSLWGNPPIFYSDADLDDAIGHPAPGMRIPTLRESLNGRLRGTEIAGKPYYYLRKLHNPTVYCCEGAYLASGGKKYLPTAQRILDLLFGANALDSSNVESVGFNQVLMRPFGQFFPSTPQIPGAVGIGYESNDHMGAAAEYDMPSVGMAMWLISLLSK